MRLNERNGDKGMEQAMFANLQRNGTEKRRSLEKVPRYTTRTRTKVMIGLNPQTRGVGWSVNQNKKVAQDKRKILCFNCDKLGH